MSRSIMSYWPSLYREAKDFVELAATEDAELQTVEEAIDQLLDDQFVMSSSEEAIKRRERMLGIRANPAMESLEFRRKRIVNRYSTKPPFTIRYLQRLLDQLAGTGRAVAQVDVPNFILRVTMAVSDADLFREIEHTIKVVKPANLVYQQQTATLEGINFIERISRQEFAWHTILGSWRIGADPFATLGPEVIVK